MIDGLVWIPSIGIRGAISFLIDTGSDCTVLMPADAQRLKLNYSLLPKQTRDGETIGAGGVCKDHVVAARVLLTVPQKLVYTWNVDLHVQPPDDSIELDIPSLLGRDILSRCGLVYDQRGKKLELSVHSADRTQQLPV